MKKLVLLLLFVAGLIGNHVFAQSSFRVQGHDRTDVPFPKTRSIALRSVEDKSFAFDNIEFWVGEGENQAALVIDWYDGKGPATVWGYRWTGDAYGIDMVRAIAKTDPRFLFLTHGTNLGSTVAGLGYDVNANGNQCLLFENDATKPYYPVDGAIATHAYNYDSWTNPDPTAHWKSGWYTGYWSYQVKDSQTDEFAYSGLGASSRKLQNGSWDGWGFADLSGMEGSVPRAPYQAAPKPVISVEKIELNKGTITLERGRMSQLQAMLYPSNATNQFVSWESDDTHVATVDQSGWVTGVAEGITVVKATTQDGEYTAACVVAVTLPTSIDQTPNEEVKVYPTVTTGAVHIEQPLEQGTVEVIAPSGAVMQSIVLSRKGTIRLSGYAPGIYFMKVNHKVVKILKK